MKSITLLTDTLLLALSTGKVLSHLNFQLPDDIIQAVAASQPGVIEFIMSTLRIKVHVYYGIYISSYNILMYTNMSMHHICGHASNAPWCPAHLQIERYLENRAAEREAAREREGRQDSFLLDGLGTTYPAAPYNPMELTSDYGNIGGHVLDSLV